MKITKVVGNQRQMVDLDVRTPTAFARALNTRDVVSTTVSTINTTTEQALLVKKLATCVRPFSVAVIEQLQEKK